MERGHGSHFSPNSLTEYQCNSVCGEIYDLPDKLIVYEFDHFGPIDNQIASDQDIKKFKQNLF